MVTKWIAISILAGLAVAMIPVVIVILWTISKAFVAALLAFALVVGLVAIVLNAIDHDIQMKKQEEELDNNDSNN